MKRGLLALCMLLTAAQAAPEAKPQWSVAALGELRTAVDAAPAEALPRLDTADLDAAWQSSDAARVDREATRLALRLAKLELLGSATGRSGWKIVDTDAKIDLAAELSAALAENRLGAFLAGLNPQHPDYLALRSAYAGETDAGKRQTLARNMERWRWMPHDLGGDYLLVNAAAYEVRLWRGGKQVGAWRVIVGKPSTPTPVFNAVVTGVNVNPWWNVPSNIVRESVGSLIRRNPGLARARGYVWSGGQVRQKPGANNALGYMKLVMPNPYSVYLHDTPNRDLFERDPRAFSHGCVRVGDALDFATALFGGTRSRTDIDALVAKGDSVVVDLPRQLPVYVTYFTAGLRGDGSFAYFPDIYGRDRKMAAAVNSGQACPV
ncbi:L,D-transpeptidase family protein [Novosphingobium sp.]|uniref:L,D-transpeptidase family protein n=1 Tax=Novosphingobium sp. TaxID=1874826 RepID=UPI0035B47661